MGQPERYLFEVDEHPLTRPVRDFLIRAYPRQHLADLSKRLFKTPEYCAACHKQFIDQELNNVGWVQLQNQFDNWRKSRWNHPGDPARTIECRECHMPLTASFDPASGDGLDYNRKPEDGQHRSHRSKHRQQRRHDREDATNHCTRHQRNFEQQAIIGCA